MGLKEMVKSLVPSTVLERVRRQRGDIGEYAFDSSRSVEAAIKTNYGYDGDLLKLFIGNKDNIVHKWHHYIPIYDRYFSRYRGEKTRFLEIGVSRGGSLQLWRKYFGEKAVIFGIDIDPACSRYDGQSGQVRIGSQADRAFLESVVREMGGIDIVLDDGSHQMAHVRASLECLFPHLADGGIYMIEDLHSAYWSRWGGGYHSSKNFYRYVGDLIDDMHRWYHRRDPKRPVISSTCAGIHIHDSIVVLDKYPVSPPVHSRIE